MCTPEKERSTNPWYWYTSEQIIAKLREAEVEVSRSATVPEACRKIGVPDQTYDPTAVCVWIRRNA